MSTYILKQGFISDIEQLYAGDYNFWFFQAWELCEPFYDSLPDWVQHMIDVFVRSGFIHVVDVDGESKLFCLIDFDLLENNGVAQIVVDEIKAYCEQEVPCYLEEWLEDRDNAEEIEEVYESVGPWGQELMQKHCAFLKDIL